LISTGELLELKLRARDGDIGSVRDLIFHDGDWSIRELIADTGGWLFGRRVGIDPDVVLEPDLVAGVLPVELTKDQVKNSPAMTKALSDEPVDEDILAWNQSNALATIPENLLLRRHRPGPTARHRACATQHALAQPGRCQRL